MEQRPWWKIHPRPEVRRKEKGALQRPRNQLRVLFLNGQFLKSKKQFLKRESHSSGDEVYDLKDYGDRLKKILGSQIETAEETEKRTPSGERQKRLRRRTERNQRNHSLSRFLWLISQSLSKDEKPRVRSPKSLLWEMRWGNTQFGIITP